MKILLGSQSPRRQEILKFFSIPFTTTSSPFDERTIPFNGDPEAYVKTLAEKKGEALVTSYPDHLIITADTIVLFEGKILHKPETPEAGREMLKILSGKSHDVLTAVAIRQNNTVYSDVETSEVTFNPLTDKVIDAYLKGKHGMDKAGGYGIQETGSLLVSRIEGCFYNIMGLPVNTLQNLLSKFQIDLWDNFS